MWVAIFGAAFIAAIACFAYLCDRVYKLLPNRGICVGGKDIRLRLFIALGIIIATVSLFSFLLGYINAIIIVIHLVVFWLLSDLLFFVVKKIRKAAFKFNYSPALAFALAFVYLVTGFALADNVWVTHYDVYTDKQIGDLRIIMFADSHVGTTFNGEEFGQYVRQMQSYDPDIVIIAGDYVDDDTSKRDMSDACKALGLLKTTYGVFYAYGNHDKGYYDNSGRGYTGDDLVRELQKNGVTVLQDEYLLVNDTFYVVGRADTSEAQRGGDRAEISDLVRDIDKTKYSVVINHQPTDYAKESKAGVDLVLSGHTHGGQMFPIGLISNIFGLNDRTYGREKRNNTEFIVTSGISDWAFKFKTGTKSEFVVIDVHGTE